MGLKDVAGSEFTEGWKHQLLLSLKIILGRWLLNTSEFTDEEKLKHQPE